jgi:hypothetical protein
MQSFTDARGAPLSIGVLSPLTGVHIETIGYYERVNMLAAPPRTRRGRGAPHARRCTRLRACILAKSGRSSQISQGGGGAIGDGWAVLGQRLPGVSFA